MFYCIIKNDLNLFRSVEMCTYIGIYTKILEVNLFAFAYRLFRRDFSPLDGTYCMGTHSFLQPYMHFVLIWGGFYEWVVLMCRLSSVDTLTYYFHNIPTLHCLPPPSVLIDHWSIINCIQYNFEFLYTFVPTFASYNVILVLLSFMYACC